MNENEKKSGGWRMILGGIVLIVLLFAAIKLVFWGLEQVIPKPPADAGASLSQDASANRSEGPDAPGFCLYCGKALPDSFQWGQFCPYCGERVQ